MSDWKNIEEAATYISLGKTILYSMAKEGRIPANKVAQKWLFNTTDLDAWIRANKPIEDFFTTTDFNIEENPQLREPQINAYKSIYDYFNSGNKTAIVQIPVGCGKSGLAAIIVECRSLIPRRCQVILPAQGKGRPRHFSPYRGPSRQQSTALSYPLASESPLVCLRFTQISLSGHNCRLIRHRWFFPVCKRLQPKAVCPCS